MAVTSEALIQKTPNVMGGEAYIRSTRIAVYNLVEMKQLGQTDAWTLRNFPQLTQEDLHAAWAYYAANSEEIESAISRNNEA